MKFTPATGDDSVRPFRDALGASHLPDGMPPGLRRAFRHSWAISFGALALTIAVRWLLDAWLGDRQPLSLVFGAVAVAVWVGSWRQALAVVVLGYVACDWLFIDPREEFGLATFAEFAAVVVFLVSCAIVIVFGEAMHHARARLLAAARHLEAKQHELERLNRELKEADTRKDDFVATLAHELRNVLAPMRNAVHIVKSRSTGDPSVVKAADIADRQVTGMTRLLEDLMDASRIRKGKIQVRKEPVTLRAVIDAAVETSRPSIDSAGHTLTVLLPEQPVQLHADPMRLTQVFSNLLNNSAKYTDPGGKIELRAVATDGRVEVRVTDNGIGFPPELGATLFSPFKQGETVNERAQGGLGIGLALVQAIVELHGGSVEAHSAGVNRGSQMVVVLPLEQGQPAATA